MTVGFMALSTAEILYFPDAMDIFPMVHLPIANISCSHVILFGNDYPVWSWSIEE